MDFSLVVKLKPYVILFSVEGVTKRGVKVNEMEKRSGIIGFTGAFRASFGAIEEGAKVVFTGSVAVCMHAFC